MGNLSVWYNNVEITPTPLVNQNYQFIDFGTRWGSSLGIELQGNVTGVQSTGAFLTLSNLFSSEFKALEVKEAGTVIYSWPNSVVEDISFPKSPLFIGSFIPYSVKLKSYNVPSGVIEPTNEYSFTQGEDSVGTLVHNISAKAIKTASNGAFQNAVNFVKNFTGKIPYGPSLFSSGTFVLMSQTENINRAEGAYSFVENYKFNTGSVNQPYIESFTLSISDIIDNEYLVIDASLTLRGSPINLNTSYVENVLASTSVGSRIASLGYDTGSFITNSISINRDTGSAVLEAKYSYLSGLYPTDVSGFFDYNVSLDNDVIIPRETWRIDGEFICKGPLSYRKERLNNFIASSGKNWKSFLSGLICSSPVYISFHNGAFKNFDHSVLNISENSLLSVFKLSLTSIDGTCDASIANPRYSVEVQPSKWLYDLLPAANIEGHYIIQDLQMKTRGKISTNISCESFQPSSSINLLSGYVNQLSTIYLKDGVSNAENITTGLTDVSYNKEWLGTDNLSSGLLATKVVGAVISDYVRVPGYKFGY